MNQEILKPINFAGGVWHGAFLAIGMTLVDTNIVIPSFIFDITGSSIWVGGLSALLVVVGSVPQIFVARFVEPLQRKRAVLLTAVYLRSASWASLGLLIVIAGPNRPKLILWGLIVLLGLFSAGGALGGVPYTDIIGKVIPKKKRGAFFAVRQATGSFLSVGAAALVGIVLALTYPINYATLFLMSALSLAIASFGVWVIHEPPAEKQNQRRLDWLSYIQSLGDPFRSLRSLTLVTLSTGFSLMAIPFYVVAAKQIFNAPPEAMAFFIGALVVGSLVANLVWGRLVDRFGSRRMILVCVFVSALTPVIALSAWKLNWFILILVNGLVGATIAGRSVGFSSALLELAPAERRATYAAVYALMTLPIAVIPLLGGLIVELLSFKILFGLTALLMLGAVAIVWFWNMNEGNIPT